ncbi:MAG: MFS transporter [Deltaproteobacteria bacterium]|nr:MFS transporter [Deltaproteobacteria bacterium]
MNNNTINVCVGNQRWGYAALCLVLYIFLGLIYAWSIFVPPLEQEFGWSRSETSMVFTFCMFFFCLGGLGSGFAIRSMPVKFIVAACALFIGVGFTLASRCASLTELYIFYGVLIGFGVGIGYNVLLTTMLKWFPDKIGFIGGLMLMGFGAGGMILGTTCAELLGAFGWRDTFFGIGVFYLIFFLAASFLLKMPGSNLVFPAKSASRKRVQESGGEVSTGQMLRRRSFQLYMLWAIFTVGIGFTLIGHGVPLALEVGAASGSAAALAGLISLFNGLGRVSGGLVFDHFGRKILMRSACLGLMITALLLFLTLREKSLTLLMISFSLGGMSFGFSVIAHSSVISTFYGMKHYPLNFSVLTMYNLFASFAPFLAGVLHTSMGSYNGLPFCILGLATVGMILAFAIRKP